MTHHSSNIKSSAPIISKLILHYCKCKAPLIAIVYENCNINNVNLTSFPHVEVENQRLSFKAGSSTTVNITDHPIC